MSGADEHGVAASCALETVACMVNAAKASRRRPVPTLRHKRNTVSVSLLEAVLCVLLRT